MPDSAFDTLSPGMINWRSLFDGASWFHWSGISAAVSADTAAVCAEAIAVAREMGLTVSCDINYRKNLWKYGKEPQEVLPPLMEQCDIFFGTDDEYEKILGMRLPKFEARDASYRPDTAGYERASAEVAARFPRCRGIVFGLRSVLSANHHLISGTLYTGGRLLSTRVYDIDNVVDCVGVGDAFVGGLIYGMAEHARRHAIRPRFRHSGLRAEKHRAGRLQSIHGRRGRPTGPRLRFGRIAR